MQITHMGRRNGKVYRTILAVLRFDDKTKEIYAVSAWKGSDWYYNIQSSPALKVETGLVSFTPQQRTLSPAEITTTFMEYRKKHPIFSRIICRIPGWKWDSTYDEFLCWRVHCMGLISHQNQVIKLLLPLLWRTKYPCKQKCMVVLFLLYC